MLRRPPRSTPPDTIVPYTARFLSPLHLGHYLGTLRNRVELQATGVELFLVVADYQVVTDRPTPGAVVSNTRDVVLDYLAAGVDPHRSEEHTSELQSLMRISSAVFCLKKKRKRQ